MITEQQLVKWAPDSARVAASIATWFNKFAPQYGLNTPIRIAAFISHLISESNSFRNLREPSSGSAHNGKTRLGNVHPRDGEKYKGRGYILITGRKNYKLLSEGLFGKGDCTFEKYPELLATPQYGMQSAMWLWYSRDINTLADVFEAGTDTLLDTITTDLSPKPA